MPSPAPIKALAPTAPECSQNRRNDKFALLFDVSLIGTVDHDIGHVGVVEQFFEWTEA